MLKTLALWNIFQFPQQVTLYLCLAKPSFRSQIQYTPSETFHDRSTMNNKDTPIIQETPRI